MEPYEALYGRPCRSPICWTEVGESSITGSDMIRDTFEKVSLIRQRLLTAQSRQISYVDVQRRPLEFDIYWALRDTRESRHCSVSVGFTAQHVRCPRGISRLHAPEVHSRFSSRSGLGRD